MAHAVVWIDIPVLNLDRAVAFYSAVLGTELARMDEPGMSLGFLPGAEGDVSGCLFVSEAVEYVENGPLVYLNCDNRLDAAVEAVVPGGGKVVKPPHAIGPHGFRAIIQDSEGNRIALHSR